MATIGKKPIAWRRISLKYAFIILAVSYIISIEWQFSTLEYEIAELRNALNNTAIRQDIDTQLLDLNTANKNSNYHTAYCLQRATNSRAYLHISSYCPGIIIYSSTLITKYLLYGIKVDEPKYLTIDAIGDFGIDLDLQMLYTPRVVKHYFPELKGVDYVKSNYLGIHRISYCKTTSTYATDINGKIVDIHNACINVRV